MSSNNKTFSTAKLRCTDQALELYLPEDQANASSPSITPLLQGVLALQCSDPSCLSGTRPGIAGPPPAIPPFELNLSVQLTQGSSGQPSLLATTGSMGAWVPVPVVDASFGVVCGEDRCGHEHSQTDLCGGLCTELKKRRMAAQLPPETMFYVYEVTDAAAALTSLRDKLIAIPVVPGQPGNPTAAAPT